MEARWPQTSVPIRSNLRVGLALQALPATYRQEHRSILTIQSVFQADYRRTHDDFSCVRPRETFTPC
jgi:hypothetical protein